MPIIGYPSIPFDHRHPDGRFDMVKCDWLNCMAGMGLAGGLTCFLSGIWWHHACPCFIDEDEMDGK